MRQLVAPEIGLATPDREHDWTRHPKLLFDPGERVAMRGRERASMFGKPRQRFLVEIIRRRLHELGLSGRRLVGPARNDEIGQRQIGLEPARCLVKDLARNAELLRLRPQCAQPSLESWIGRLRGGRQHKKGQQWKHEPRDCCHFESHRDIRGSRDRSSEIGHSSLANVNVQVDAPHTHSGTTENPTA